MRKKQIFIAAIVGLITFLVYLPALQNGFVNWDDNKYVTENPHIQSLNLRLLKWAFFEFYFSNWHPITNISYAVDYAIWGLNPFGYHLANNIFHSLNTFLVVLLSMQILTVTGRLSDKAILMASAITGLLFGIHPIHVESVAWVSERKDVLCAFFFLLSLMSYIRYAVNLLTPSFPLKLRGMKGGYLLSLIFFILALMSKPMAVTLPVVMLILDWYPLGRLKRGNVKAVFIEKLPFFALSLASSVITILAQGEAIVSEEYVPFLRRIIYSGNALLFYLYKFFFPDVLLPFYPHPKNIFSLYHSHFLLALTITVITIFSILYKNKKILIVILGCYFVTLLPVLGIIQVGMQAAADRYAYLPSISIFLFLGASIGYFYIRGKKNVRIFLVIFSVSLLVLLGYKTGKQIHIWKDSITLWRHAITELPARPETYYTSAELYNNLGAAYMEHKTDNKMLDMAIQAYRTAIELKPDYSKPFYNIGIIYSLKGQLETAVQTYKMVLLMDPDYAAVYLSLGDVYFKMGLIDKAIEHFQIAIRLKPDLTDAYNNLGIIYIETGMIDKAIGDFQTALKINPNHADVHFNIALAYEKKGMMGEAARHYQEVIRLNPEDEAARNNLNRILQGKR